MSSGVTTKGSDRANPGAPKSKGAPGQNVIGIGIGIMNRNRYKY
jgi:hypothetical protein